MDIFIDRRQTMGPRKLELVKKVDKTSSGPIWSEQLMMFDWPKLSNDK